MSDNLIISSAAQFTLATDEVSSGVHAQRVKIGFGADGSITDVSSSAPLPVYDAGGSLTVDGTIAATQSGTWTVTGAAGTFPITAASLPLPSGAATAAKQPALGTAGTASADVITVQGVTSMTALKVDGSAVTQPVSGTVTVNALPAGSNTVGDVGVIGRTSGGLSISRTIGAASTNATSVKASAGQVFGIIVTNVNAAVRYLKLYNKASAPTVGTDTPVMTLVIPGSTTGGGLVFNTSLGIAFATGIAFALTTGVADADTAAVAANEQIVQLLYK